MDFSNKVALVTGAAVGIGRATALQLAERGADVILLDINEEKLNAVKAECAALGRDAQSFVCDISDEAKVNDVIAAAMAHFGRIDILVNNAALWREFTPFTELSAEKWHLFFNINVFGTVYVTRAVLPAMLAQGFGRVINVASVAGVYGNGNMTAYSATKGAVISLTKALAKEVADKGVTVNAVSPGSVSDSSDENVDAVTSSSLSYMGRTGSDRENANLICFLASEGAGYISGQNIQIDGCRKKL